MRKYSGNKSCLKDLDKHYIILFVIHFCVKYLISWLQPAALKFLDFRFLQVFESVRLSLDSLRLCTILMQFATVRLFSGHIESVLHFTYSSTVCFLTLSKTWATSPSFLARFSGLEYNTPIQNLLPDCNSCLSHEGGVRLCKSSIFSNYVQHYW